MKISANKGFKKYIILTLISISLISLFISFLIFYPKKMEGLVSFDNVAEVKLVQIDNGEVLPEFEIESFENALTTTKYRKRICLIKSANSKYYEIKYNDGTKIIIGNYIYQKYNSDGEVVDSFQYIVYGDLF